MDQAITGPDWFVVLVLMVIFIDAMRGFNGSARVFRWLKGSRVSFYLRASDGGLEYQSCNMRGAISVPVIELSRGPFRRQSALYGRNSENWKIAVGHWNVNSIELQDRKGIPVKTALKLVNDFPSLQAMLDRIANLEEELNRVKTQLDLQHSSGFAWASGVMAVLKILEEDRQRYRSKPAEHVKKCLVKIQRNWDKIARDTRPRSFDDRVMAWKKLFPPLDV